MKLGFLVIVLSIAVAGCAASGVQVKEDQLAGFEPGKTTLSEVIEVLGKPTNRIRSADGTTMIMYNYAEARARGATFIPIVGLFAGGVDVNHSMATLRFDKFGKLIDHSMSEGQMGTASGAAVDPEPVLDQPRKPQSSF